jgi:hypothetical protein
MIAVMVITCPSGPAIGVSSCSFCCDMYGYIRVSS